MLTICFTLAACKSKASLVETAGSAAASVATVHNHAGAVFFRDTIFAPATILPPIGGNLSHSPGCEAAQLVPVAVRHSHVMSVDSSRTGTVSSSDVHWLQSSSAAGAAAAGAAACFADVAACVLFFVLLVFCVFLVIRFFR